jgi:hypothetical protein
MMRRADFRGWFLLACCAAPLGGVSAQGALQLGGQPPKQIEMELCTIGDVFGKVNQITSDPSCRAGCAGGTGECPDPTWMPAAADECNPQCGQIFEPFWCVRNGPHRSGFIIHVAISYDPHRLSCGSSCFARPSGSWTTSSARLPHR